MADINVTLGLDDSQYTNKLKAAETAASQFGSKTTTSLNNIKNGGTIVTAPVRVVNATTT